MSSSKHHGLSRLFHRRDHRKKDKEPNISAPAPHIRRVPDTTDGWEIPEVRVSRASEDNPAQPRVKHRLAPGPSVQLVEPVSRYGPGMGREEASASDLVLQMEAVGLKDDAYSRPQTAYSTNFSRPQTSHSSSSRPHTSYSTKFPSRSSLDIAEGQNRRDPYNENVATRNIPKFIAHDSFENVKGVGHRRRASSGYRTRYDDQPQSQESVVEVPPRGSSKLANQPVSKAWAAPVSPKYSIFPVQDGRERDVRPQREGERVATGEQGRSLRNGEPTRPGYAAQESREPNMGRTDPQNGYSSKPGYLVHDSPDPVDLEGVVDLRNTEDVDRDVRYAPAVTHEKRLVDTHEIVQQSITREIHNDHIFHRIQPILDVEVLPPRHYNQDPITGDLTEISDPGGPKASQRLQAAMQRVAEGEMLARGEEIPATGYFTKHAVPEKRDERFDTEPDGYQFSERTWIHPPVLETGGKESGQTIPFHFVHHET